MLAGRDSSAVFQSEQVGGFGRRTAQSVGWGEPALDQQLQFVMNAHAVACAGVGRVGSYKNSDARLVHFRDIGHCGFIL